MFVTRTTESKEMNPQTSPNAMKVSRTIACASAALCLAFLAGCATPEARIKSSPEAFARLNPTEQDLVKQGKIAPGFSMEAVKLALGDPSRITIQTDASGQHEIWHYIEYEDAQGVVIYTGYYHRYWGWGGPRFWAGGPYYNGFPVRIHDRISVVYDNAGRVSAIQEDKP